MKKKFLALFLVLSFACMQVVGCGSDEKTDSSKEKTEAVDDKEADADEEEEKEEEK